MLRIGTLALAVVSACASPLASERQVLTFLTEAYYRNPSRLVTLLDNHDLERRIMSHVRYQHPGDHNKALAYKIVKLCLGTLFTVRGIPQIYYGTEIGLEGWKEGNDDSRLRRFSVEDYRK